MRMFAVMLLVLVSCGRVFADDGFSKVELHAGYYFDQHIVGSQVLLFDSDTLATVREIGDRIATAASIDSQLTYRVLNTPIINAYSVPGGFLYVTTGLLTILENDDELAAVMAHELAHTAAGHYKLQWDKVHARAGVADFGLGMLAIYVRAWGDYASSQTSSVAEYFRIAATQGVTQGTTTIAARVALVSLQASYSRASERQADEFAVKYAKRAGYDPRAMIMLMKRIQFVTERNNYLSELAAASPFLRGKHGIDDRIRRLERMLTGTEG